MTASLNLHIIIQLILLNENLNLIAKLKILTFPSVDSIYPYIIKKEESLREISY